MFQSVSTFRKWLGSAVKNSKSQAAKMRELHWRFRGRQWMLERGSSQAPTRLHRPDCMVESKKPTN